MFAMTEPYSATNPLLLNSPEISAAKRQPSISSVSDLSNSFFMSLSMKYCLFKLYDACLKDWTVT